MKLSEFYRSDEVFGELSPVVKKRIDHVISCLNQLDGSFNLLDYGCGTCFLEKLLPQKAKYHGCDISTALKEADNLRLIVDDRIPFDDDLFDVVYAGEVIEHILDTGKFLKEITRVLKKNGLLIITTPNLSFWLNRILVLCGYQPYFTELCFEDKTFGRPNFLNKYERQKTAMGHIRIFVPKGLKDILVDYRLDPFLIKTIPIQFNPVFYAADKFFSALGMGSDIFCVSKNLK